MWILLRALLPLLQQTDSGPQSCAAQSCCTLHAEPCRRRAGCVHCENCTASETDVCACACACSRAFQYSVWISMLFGHFCMSNFFKLWKRTVGARNTTHTQEHHRLVSDSLSTLELSYQATFLRCSTPWASCPPQQGFTPPQFHKKKS